VVFKILELYLCKHTNELGILGPVIEADKRHRESTQKKLIGFIGKRV
jgi:hypothetical protein